MLEPESVSYIAAVALGAVIGGNLLTLLLFSTWRRYLRERRSEHGASLGASMWTAVTAFAAALAVLAFGAALIAVTL